MKPTTIITAFFNIGREDFNAVPRSLDTYFDQFQFWARLKNPLVVYTTLDSRERILEIRESFGLRNRTTVVVIDDLFAIEPDIFQEMLKVSKDHWFRDFRLLPDATSGIAQYSYLMLLKTWFVADAVSRGLTNETTAWLDFGFNHAGRVYPKPEEFDFEWKCDDDYYDKVVLFSMADPYDRPIFEFVRRLTDYIMGAMIIIPKSRANDLWAVNRESMLTLLRMGLIDDDQLIQLMSVRAQPDLFEVRRSEWFHPLRDASGAQMTIRSTRGHLFPLRQVRLLVHWARRQRRAVQAAVRLYLNLVRGRP